MKKLMTGNEAIARGAYEAGVKYASAYPGTPSTEVTEEIAKYATIYDQKLFEVQTPYKKVFLKVF